MSNYTQYPEEVQSRLTQGRQYVLKSEAPRPSKPVHEVKEAGQILRALLPEETREIVAYTGSPQWEGGRGGYVLYVDIHDAYSNEYLFTLKHSRFQRFKSAGALVRIYPDAAVAA